MTYMSTFSRPLSPDEITEIVTAAWVGYDDYVVGAPYSDANGTNSGQAFVLSGWDDTLLWEFTGRHAGTDRTHRESTSRRCPDGPSPQSSASASYRDNAIANIANRTSEARVRRSRSSLSGR